MKKEKNTSLLFNLIISHKKSTTCVLFPLMKISLLAFLPILVRADYPGQLQWSGSGCGSDYSFCATLEFCKEGSNYGYRTVGDTSACGSKPGPLIRMTPGNKYKLTLHNSADPSVLTNIHTHGLHIVGNGDGDDVTRFVDGGSCLDYTWDIAVDHPGGTNWYHPHKHELTAEQTGGGAFGMLIIEDDYQNLNTWAHPENELVLQISDIGSGTVGNGNSNENIQVEVGKWYRLRMSVVTPGAKAADVSFSGGDCTVYRVASDGVWHSAALTTYAGSSFELTGASRADFAINCASSATTQIEWDRATSATLEAGSFGSGTGSDETDLGTAPSRPYALYGLTDGDAWDTFSISLSAAKINGAPWDPNTPLGMIDYDKVHEWTISGSGAHPFHLHLYHMLIVEPGGCGAHQEGEFYDTISAQGSCTVRFKTADFGQRMIMHCHVLKHEDNGAINFLDVVGVPALKQNNVDSPAYVCSSGPAPDTPAPTPAAVPDTPAPTPAAVPDTPAPAAGEDPVCSTTSCSNNSDCCSNVCNTNSNKCRK